MPHLRISEAAQLMGVSDDTVRRWIDAGRLGVVAGSSPAQVDGAELARLAQDQATAAPAHSRLSARNRLDGLVTRVISDEVMAQVDLQCGPFRVVSLMSAEAARELELEPGARASASIKATNVIVEVP